MLGLSGVRGVATLRGMAAPRSPRTRAGRVALVAAGIFFTVLAAIGVILPLIPTTGPLLLAAALFARSSERFHRWLLNHRLFGTYLRNYREKRGMTRGHKVWTLVTLWAGIGVSIYLSREALAAIIVLVIVLVGVTIHILTLRTADGRSADGHEVR